MGFSFLCVATVVEVHQWWLVAQINVDRDDLARITSEWIIAATSTTQDPLHAGGRTPLGTYFSWFRPLVFILFDQYRWCDHLSFLFTSILLSFICNSVTRTNSFHLFFIPRSFRTSPAFLSHDLFFLLHSFASFLFFHLHNIYRIVYS